MQTPALVSWSDLFRLYSNEPKHQHTATQCITSHKRNKEQQMDNMRRPFDLEINCVGTTLQLILTN